jgi:hypothetical protein
MCSCPLLYILNYHSRYEEWKDIKNKMEIEQMEQDELVDDDDDQHDDENEQGTSY